MTMVHSMYVIASFTDSVSWLLLCFADAVGLVAGMTKLCSNNTQNSRATL